MDSKQLRACLAEDPKMRSIAGGVMAIDELPTTPAPGRRLFIINTQPSSQPGAHWLAIYFPTNAPQPVEFFDALGQSPENYPSRIMQFIMSGGQDYVYQTQALQSSEANTCGHFCLYYLVHRVRGINLETLFKDFSVDHYIVNEQRVIDFVKKHFISF